MRRILPSVWNNAAFWPVVIVAAWFFASAHWLLGRYFIPWDSVDAFFPQTSFVVSAIIRGEAPWWNPLSFGGMPVLGDPQGLVFTPHTLTGWLSGRRFGLWVFDITTLLCVLAGGLGLFAYLRQHAALAPMAALGAMVFMFAGVATSRLQHVPQIVSYGLLPLVLLAFRMAVQRPGIGPGALLGLVGLLLTLNPNHVVFLAPFLLAPVLLYEWAKAPRRIAATLTLGAAAVIILAGLAPSAAAIIETMGFSTRRSLALEDSLPASLPGFTLWSLVLPAAFIGAAGAPSYWGPADMTESYLYLGVVPLAILLAGLLRRERPPLLFSLALGGIALSFAFAMGARGAVFPWLFENIPGFAAFRRPSDGAYFVNLYAALAVGLALAPGSGRLRSMAERLGVPALCLLPWAWTLPALFEHAALRGGSAALRQAGLNFGMQLVLAAGVLGSIALMRFLPRPGRAGAIAMAACVLTTVSLSFSGRYTVFAADYRQNGVARLFRELARWETRPGGEAESLRLLARAGGREARSEVIGGDLARQGPMAFGFPLSQGYNPVSLSPYAEVFGAQNLSAEPKRFSEIAPDYQSAAYRWAGLGFVLLHAYIIEHAEQFGEFGRRLLELRAGLESQGARRLEGSGTYELWQLPAPYPRGSLIPMEGGEAGPPTGRCTILRETTTLLRYDCDSPSDARLVIPDSFAPGWLACVNTTPAVVMPFLRGLRTVILPPGRSEVTLRYVATPFMRSHSDCAVR